MAIDYAGTVATPNVLLDASHLAFGPTGGTPYDLALTSALAVSGARGVGSPGAPAGTPHGGTISDGFGGRCLFERVLLVPQRVDLGAVLTQRTVHVTIWNTFREVEKFLTAAVIAGTGSAEVGLPTLPLGFVPFGDYVQDVVFPTEGDPLIAQTVDFVFAAISGTTLVVTGNRLAVFGAAEPNWEPDGITEIPQMWMTDILKAYSDAEQRVQLRTLPRSQLKYRVTPDRLTKSLLEALLWGWQGQVYGVPYWPDNQALLSDATAGDVVVHFDTSDREFRVGGLLMIWRGPFLLEAIPIVALVSGGVQVASGGIANSYPADGRTRCVPVRRARITDVQDITRTTCEVAEMDITFDCEVV